LDAISFAQGAIEEAEAASLDAVYARANAVALSSWLSAMTIANPQGCCRTCGNGRWPPGCWRWSCETKVAATRIEMPGHASTRMPNPCPCWWARCRRAFQHLHDTAADKQTKLDLPAALRAPA